MSQFPKDQSPDSTISLLREGYTFTLKRFAGLESDVFETRLMLRKVICTRGEEAARMFYHPDRFTRKKAMPPTALLLLQDKGSVQQLSGAAHRKRKEMFMSMMSPEQIRRLGEQVKHEWLTFLRKWEQMDRVVLHKEVQEILCRGVCKWAGIVITEPEAAQRTSEFAAMIDGAGSVGPRNWRGLYRRSRTEDWAQNLIRRIRSGELEAEEGSPLNLISFHQDSNGKVMDIKEAAVELLNVLRPTVAVARFITFAALALHRHPECRGKLRAGEDNYLENFVQEVRRYYPYFPLIGGRVREEFNWREHFFKKGDWVILDLYGTNHDPRIWEKPEEFRPERFAAWQENAYNFIPQGAGDFHNDHRCPGEWITIELMKTAVKMLTQSMEYSVPEQNLEFSLHRMPAIPESRFIINHVKQLP
ncbi:MAG: cytochrome P450 [Calditrichia bacterium]